MTSCHPGQKIDNQRRLLALTGAHTCGVLMDVLECLAASADWHKVEGG